MTSWPGWLPGQGSRVHVPALLKPRLISGVLVDPSFQSKMVNIWMFSGGVWGTFWTKASFFSLAPLFAGSSKRNTRRFITSALSPFSYLIHVFFSFEIGDVHSPVPGVFQSTIKTTIILVVSTAPPFLLVSCPLLAQFHLDLKGRCLARRWLPYFYGSLFLVVVYSWAL